MLTLNTSPGVQKVDSDTVGHFVVSDSVSPLVFNEKHLSWYTATIPGQQEHDTP